MIDWYLLVLSFSKAAQIKKNTEILTLKNNHKLLEALLILTHVNSDLNHYCHPQKFPITYNVN